MSVKENYDKIKSTLNEDIALIAVVKNQSYEDIKELYESGQKIFAENKVQDLLDKMDFFKEYNMTWHFIGHLQRNKVKYINVHTLNNIES